MMESRPRSVLAAFQEHLQLASTKCGSLMEQLNIVRKKVEGKEAVMNASDHFSDGFLENVSQKTVLQPEESDLLDDKEQMALGNAYVERSTGDTNCDINNGLLIRKRSQQVVANKEEVPYLNGTVTKSNENERYSLKLDAATNHKHSKEKLIKESVKISGKTSLNAISGKEEESFDEDLSSDDDSSSLSSSLSSKREGKEVTDKENLFKELLKRLQDNEEKNNTNKNRSSSENSSSSSQKMNKSPKKNSSNSTVNEDNFDKKNGDIENLDVGVEFFLPSSATEKFQKMYCEDSADEEQKNTNGDKNMRVTFDDLIVGGPTKKHISGETTSSQNRLSSETSIKTKASPKQSEHHGKNGKGKENKIDSSSILTKSEKIKKQNTILNSSALVDFKLHSPEMNLYKRLNGTQLKKMGGRKDKYKKNTVANFKLKAKHNSTEPNLKISLDEKNIVASNISKNIKKESKPTITVSIKEKDGGKDIMITNKTQLKDNSFFSDNNLHTKSKTEIAANPQPKNVFETKQSSNINVKKDILNHNLNKKMEAKHYNIINSSPKNHSVRKSHIEKLDNLANLKEKNNPDPKNLISKKNNVVMSERMDIRNEKLPQTRKNVIVEKIPDCAKIECQKKKNAQTTIKVKEFSSKHRPINEEIPAMNEKLKNSKEHVRNISAPLVQSKKETNKYKSSPTRKEGPFDVHKFHPFDKSSKTKEPSECKKGRNHLTKEATHSQSINEMKAHITSFPFILGQSTSKTYNVRAAIQQTMSMIMTSPAETLRRSSFSEMLNVSSKASTLRTSASCTSGRKACPACVLRVDEEDNEPDENPIDPWDTEYHSKRFFRCTCMPRNTVNFKTVMNQLLHETSSSYTLPTESYQESEVENGEDNRVNKSLFRRNNNSHKLSKLLHTLLKIRDLLVT